MTVDQEVIKQEVLVLEAVLRTPKLVALVHLVEQVIPALVVNTSLELSVPEPRPRTPKPVAPVVMLFQLYTTVVLMQSRLELFAMVPLLQIPKPAQVVRTP